MKQKGFTLIELLVTIASALIIVATITSSVYFISRVSNDVIVDSNNNIKVRTVRDYIIDKKIDSDKLIDIKDTDVSYKTNVIATNTNIYDIIITYNNTTDFYKCTIYFNGSNGNEELTFNYQK